MSLYRYSALKVSAEIRLLELLPGSYDKEINLKIFHTSFLAPKGGEEHEERIAATVKEIRATLPPQWTGPRNLEGVAIFRHAENKENVIRALKTHGNAEHRGVVHSEAPEMGRDSPLPEYEAFSYTWGSKDNATTANVQKSSNTPPGVEAAPTVLQIGQNLAVALRHLRYPNEARTLWIDAICINQEEIAERNEQVRQMGDIYRFAARVVVWLGEESSNSRLAISTLDYLGRQSEITTDFKRNPSANCEEPLWHDMWHPLPYSEKIWQAIFDLLGRPWFSRLWVMQEIQLGSRFSSMQCGYDILEWRLFHRAISCLNDKQEGPSRELRRRLGPIDAMAGVKGEDGVTPLLNQARGRKCEEKHDKVYAILAIIPAAVASKISPNYSLPFQTVFKDIFLAYVNVVRRLDLMRTCNIVNSLTDLPTWAPNWCAAIRAQPMYGLGLRASCLSSAHVNYLPPNLLEVVGVRFSAVSDVETAEIGSIADAIDFMQKVGLEALQKTPYPGGGTLFGAFAWTICAAQLRDRFEPGDMFLTSETFQQSILAAMKHPDRVVDIGKDLYFWHWVHTYLMGRRLLRTESGHVGTVVGVACPGDHVCIILGCDVPIVIHPLPDGSHTVVGECYLHGLTDGEALLGPLPEPWTLRIVSGSKGLWAPAYFNTSTETLSREDPRLEVLGPLSTEAWEAIDTDSARQPHDPKFFQKFRDRRTGEVVNSDPRFLPDALRARGIELETLKLV